MSFKLKQVFLALCVSTSLLFGAASTCTCSHHQESAKATESDCHSGSHARDQIADTDGNCIDETCICVANVRAPLAISKPLGKEFKSAHAISGSQCLTADVEFVAIRASFPLSPEFARDLSYSRILKSLLPSRAPPRL
jgi:hypothetical protein